ncbi:hypothetical protein LV779_10445 [Streptomyces thinghirensis]|nr:hypothetical protein [Streptomyces thinghirensis]
MKAVSENPRSRTPGSSHLRQDFTASARRLPGRPPAVRGRRRRLRCPGRTRPRHGHRGRSRHRFLPGSSFKCCGSGRRPGEAVLVFGAVDEYRLPRSA